MGMQMKKQFSRLLVLVGLVGLVFSMLSFPTNSLAVEKDLNSEKSSGIGSDSRHELYYLIEDDVNDSISVLEDDIDNSVSPMGFYVYKDKTVPRDYVKFEDMEESIIYEEYSGGYWWRGTLFWVSAVKTSKGYTATFSGKLARWVE